MTWANREPTRTTARAASTSPAPSERWINCAHRSRLRTETLRSEGGSATPALVPLTFLLPNRHFSPAQTLPRGAGAMIRPERLTVKAAEALQQAGVLARARGNPVVNDAHLFAALLAQDDGIVVPLLPKAGLNVHQPKAETERELDRFPKQSGTAAG